MAHGPIPDKPEPDDFEPYLTQCTRCCDGRGRPTPHETVIASEADAAGAVIYMLDGWLKYWCYQDMPNWLKPRYRDLTALRELASIPTDLLSRPRGDTLPWCNKAIHKSARGNEVNPRTA
jgi:hypothetical protein